MNVIDRNNVQVLDGAEPALVYAHGFGCSQAMWAGVTPAFMGQRRQVLFDYVGAGHSDLGAFTIDRYGTLAGYARDLIEVCEATSSGQPVILVAHSVSCSIGMLAAIERPELFRQMVLVGPNPCFINDPPYTGGFEREDLQALLELIDQNFMGWADFLAPVVGQGDVVTGKRLHQSFCSLDPMVAKAFAQATFFADNRADAARVPVPCLILQHREDALAPLAVGEFLHRQLPRSELRLLDVTGHCAHMSQPELVVDAIRDVLDR